MESIDATSASSYLEYEIDPGEWERIDMFWPYCVLMAVNVCILGPICVVLTMSYHGKRHKAMYSGRAPGLVMMLNCAAIFMLTIYIPAHIIFFEILWKNNGKWTEWYVLFLFVAQCFSYILWLN